MSDITEDDQLEYVEGLLEHVELTIYGGFRMAVQSDGAVAQIYVAPEKGIALQQAIKTAEGMKARLVQMRRLARESAPADEAEMLAELEDQAKVAPLVHLEVMVRVWCERTGSPLPAELA